MLVLTRKLDEKIKIGDDITITIIKVRNNQIRIGIEAPRDVRVLRGELEQTVVESVSDIQPQRMDAAKKTKPVNNRVSEMLADSPTGRLKPANVNTIDGMACAADVMETGAMEATTSKPSSSNPSSSSRFRTSDLEATGDTGAPKLAIYSGKVSTATGEGNLRCAPLSGFFTAP